MAAQDDHAAQQRARHQALQQLFDELQAQPRLHDFFATVRRIEGLNPQWPRMGQALLPSQEGLRLGQEPELDFAPAAIESLERGSSAVPWLRVRFFGLLGPQGPMPLHFTEYTRERKRNRKDPTLARFLDVFHHRMLALFYRAWAQNQPVVQHDRPAQDRYAAWLGACAGLAPTQHVHDGRGNTAPPRAGALPRTAALAQAGLLSQRSRHPEGLAKLLMTHFRVPVRIEQHVAQWLQIDTHDRSALGHARNRAERSEDALNRLGLNTTSGHKQLDRQYKFRIVMGPLDKATYDDLLPGGRAWRDLGTWVRQYTGMDLRWDVQLVLDRTQVPQPHPDGRQRLGVSSWIGRGTNDRDRADLRLRRSTPTLAAQRVRTSSAAGQPLASATHA